jgi:cyclopropane-fatty-acyl-phospholipid synthase
MISKIAFNKFLKSLESIQFGTLKLTCPNGKEYFFSGKNKGPKAELTLHKYSVITNIVAKGDIGFAEDYRDGKWDSENLAALVELSLKNADALDGYIYGKNLFKVIAKISYLFRVNTLKGSKRNIHAHYDLGNDFYKLWLDPSMTYSSAIFRNEKETLLKAQHNKYDRILDLFGSRPSEILEIGCGWGGFAERAAEKYDHKIKGLTLSNQQHDYATKRLKKFGNNTNIAIEDYRIQQGKFDYIASIEMFEAVGEKFWPVYFQKISSTLKSKGKAVIQTITIGDKYFDSYRKSGDLIRSFIFPGGMLPSESRFKEEAKKAGLKITDKFNFGKDYAKTLSLWLEEFDKKIDDVKALGFDKKFIRIWRLYLATCIASFTAGRTDVMQVELRHF